jgi:hypothetical protein
MSWKFVSAWHEPLRQVLIPPKGNVLATGERADLIRRLPGIGSKAQFIQPSDHLDDLRQESKYWYRLLRALSNPQKLRSVFKQAPPPDARPHDHFSFSREAQFSNTLPVSLEWHGKDPYAVVEAITASELLVAAAWG